MGPLVRRLLPFVAVAAGVVATALAVGSSPALLPGAGSWFGDNWQYGALLIAWSAMIGLTPDLCREIRHPWSLIGGIAAAMISSAVGYGMLPMGGYDLYAKVRLYWYCFLAGLAFVLAVRRAGAEKPGSNWPRDSAVFLTAVFALLSGVFVAGREGGLRYGPAMPSGGPAYAHRLLYESPHAFGSYDIAAELDGPDAPKVAFLLSRLEGDGAVIDLESGVAYRFSLAEGIKSGLFTGDQDPGDVRSVRLSKVTMSWEPGSGDGGGSPGVDVSGRADINFVRGGSQSDLDFLATIGLPGSGDAGSVLIRSVEPGEYDRAASLAAPVLDEMRPLDDRSLGSSMSSLSITDDSQGVALLDGDRVVWRLRIAPTGYGQSERAEIGRAHV